MAEISMEEAPRKVRELFDKGYAAMERGNLDYAMDMFTSALDLEPGVLKARKFLRAAQIKKKGKGSAFGHLMSNIGGAGSIVGINATIKKKPLDALKKVEKLLRSDPLNLTFLKLYDQAAIAADLPEVAVLNMEIAKEHHPKNTDIVDRLGALYLEVNDTQKARECFERLVQMKPKDQAALKKLKDAAALDTMKSGGWEGAESYRDVIKDSKATALLEQEGKSVRSSTGVEALIKDTLGKIQREPENVNYRRALGDLYVRAHRYDEAIEVLQQALEMSGGADPEVDRALATTREKQFDGRIAELTEAGDTAGAEAVTVEKSEFLFATAQERVRKYPNDLQFKYDLGVLFYHRDQITEAVQQLQAAQRNPQRRIMALYHLALCFKAKNQYDIAAEQLEKAKSELPIMDDNKKAVLYELGQVAEAMGNAEKAIAHYKEIYAVDIGYEDVADKIEQGYSS